MNLREGYKNDLACSTFADFIARDLKESLSKTLQMSKFYCLQMDGSTDSANVEEELFLVNYFDSTSTDGSVHVRNEYFCVRQPKSINALG